NRVVAHFDRSTVPGDVDRHAIGLQRSNASVEQRGVEHIACRKHLRRLLAAGPPYRNVLLDLVELGKGSVQAFLGGQHVVYVSRGHTVGNQGELQVLHRGIPQGAATREVLHVPEILPARERLAFWHLVCAIADGDGIGHRTNGGRHARHLGNVLVRVDVVPVQWLQPALLCGDEPSIPFGGANVPLHIPRHLLNADLGNGIVSRDELDGCARLLLERHATYFLDGVTPGTTVSGEHNGGFGQGSDRRNQQCGQQTDRTFS